jgi:hypothetical protein
MSGMWRPPEHGLQRERFDLAPAGVGAPAITFADSAAQPARHRNTSTLSRMLAWQLERDSNPA